VDCSADPSQPDPQPDPQPDHAPTIGRPDLKFNLLRLTAQAVRVTASTITVVVLLRQQWVAAGAFALIWLLILGAPRVLPLLVDSEEQQNVGTTDQDDDTFELKPGSNGR
jgi:hypothetical protein